MKKNLSEKEHYLERYLRTRHYMTEFGKKSIAPSENMLSIKFDCSRKISRNVFERLTRTRDLIPVKGKGYVYSYKGLRYICNLVPMDEITKVNLEKYTIGDLKKNINSFLPQKSLDGGTFSFVRSQYSGEELISFEYNLCFDDVFLSNNSKDKKDICKILAESGLIVTSVKKEVIITNNIDNKISKLLGYDGEKIPIIMSDMYEGEKLLMTQVALLNAKKFKIEFTY